MSNGNTIDGTGRDATRHINHSCLPNCEAAEEFGARGRLVVRIYTLVPLRAGEEAFLDYVLIIDEADSPADYPCHCGVPGCRGTMVATAPAAEEDPPDDGAAGPLPASANAPSDALRTLG